LRRLWSEREAAIGERALGCAAPPATAAVPPTHENERALAKRLRLEATDGRHELFKSTKVFDGPHHRKQHGFDLG
jgi:hypothetical protein